MYCQQCGAQLESDAQFCAQCGTWVGAAPLHPEKNTFVDVSRPNSWNRYALWGFVGAIFAPLCGLFLCIYARKQCARSGEQGASLAKAGIILSACLMVIYPILIVIGLGWYLFS